MAENKSSFLLYRDIIHTVKHLSDQKAGKLFKHILEYVNDKDPKLDNLELRLAFEPIKQSLKRYLRKYENICLRNKENGKKGGRPSKEIKPKKPSGLIGNPTKPKKADSDSDSDSDIYKENINKRKTEFKKLLAEHKEKYPDKMLKDFEGYWTEHGPNDKKMRYEKQTSFSIARRLTTWKGRSNGTYDNDDESYTPV